MKFVQIIDLNNCVDVKQLYHESFPIEEQVEFEKLFSGVFGEYKLYGVYENEILVAMVHFCGLDNFVHINYLAVKSDCQSKGYGTACLNFVKDLYSNIPLVLDIEEIDENADNNINRIRRIEFYRKNGFVNGKYKFMWQGTLMTYMHTKRINDDEFMKYIKVVFPTITDISLK